MVRALDLFPPEVVDDEDVELMPVLIEFVRLNDIRCFAALCTQWESNGLNDWSRSVKRNADFWLNFFYKWTRYCDGCQRTDGEMLDGLDWSI